MAETSNQRDCVIAIPQEGTHSQDQEAYTKATTSQDADANAGQPAIPQSTDISDMSMSERSNPSPAIPQGPQVRTANNKDANVDIGQPAIPQSQDIGDMSMSERSNPLPIRPQEPQEPQEPQVQATINEDVSTNANTRQSAVSRSRAINNTSMFELSNLLPTRLQKPQEPQVQATSNEDTNANTNTNTGHLAIPQSRDISDVSMSERSNLVPINPQETRIQATSNGNADEDTEHPTGIHSRDNSNISELPSPVTANPPSYSSSLTRADESSAVKTWRKWLGLGEKICIIDEHLQKDSHKYFWCKVRAVMREPFAEFCGTFVMILLGNASVAQTILCEGEISAPLESGFGADASVGWGSGIGAMLGMYVAGDSGGFLNPAATFCSCVFRGLSWKRLPIYVFAQLLGGFCAAGVVYANNILAIKRVELEDSKTSTTRPINITAGIFSTYPPDFATKGSQFGGEFTASAILLFGVFALKDVSNQGAMGESGAKTFFPISLLFLVLGLGVCFGWETGYAINIARDLPPRVMSCMLGYRRKVWTAYDYYFVVPLVAPLTGSFTGALLYDLFIYTGSESPINTPFLGLKDLLLLVLNGFKNLPKLFWMICNGIERGYNGVSNCCSYEEQSEGESDVRDM